MVVMMEVSINMIMMQNFGLISIKVTMMEMVFHIGLKQKYSEQIRKSMIREEMMMEMGFLLNGSGNGVMFLVGIIIVENILMSGYMIHSLGKIIQILTRMVMD